MSRMQTVREEARWKWRGRGRENEENVSCWGGREEDGKGREDGRSEKECDSFQVLVMEGREGAGEQEAGRVRSIDSGRKTGK